MLRPFTCWLSSLTICTKSWKVSSIYYNNILFKAHEKNVVVIHCNSGKGRAGTSCVCLLYYIKFCNSIHDCAQVFGKKRFTDNETGVSQPCQVRFIHYFEAFLNGLVKSPEIKILKRITIKGFYKKMIAIQISKVGPLEDVEKHRENMNHHS